MTVEVKVLKSSFGHGGWYVMFKRSVTKEVRASAEAKGAFDTKDAARLRKLRSDIPSVLRDRVTRTRVHLFTRNSLIININKKIKIKIKHEKNFFSLL